MKLPNLENNRFSYRSCFRYSQPNTLKIDHILLGKVNDFTGNFSNPMAKSLKCNSPIKPDPKEVISPNLNNNQGSFLRNLNDYHIEENYNVDDKRLLKFIARRKPEYNLINHVNKYNYFPSSYVC